MFIWVQKGWYKGSEKVGPEIEKMGKGENKGGGSSDGRGVDASTLQGC